MDRKLKYDFENGEKIYNSLLELFEGNVEDSYYEPSEENVLENEPDGEIELEEGIININAGFDSSWCMDNNGKLFSIEIVDTSDLIKNYLKDIQKIVNEYPEWELVK